MKDEKRKIDIAERLYQLEQQLERDGSSKEIEDEITNIILELPFEDVIFIDDYIHNKYLKN